MTRDDVCGELQRAWLALQAQRRENMQTRMDLRRAEEREEQMRRDFCKAQQAYVEEALTAVTGEKASADPDGLIAG